MSLETEIPEILFTEMNDFIELNSDIDRQSFLNMALTQFLLENGCKFEHLKKSYSKYLLNHSSK